MTDRQTDRQGDNDRQGDSDRQADRQTDRKTVTDRQIDRQKLLFSVTREQLSEFQTKTYTVQDTVFACRNIRNGQPTGQKADSTSLKSRHWDKELPNLFAIWKFRKTLSVSLVF